MLPLHFRTCGIRNYTKGVYIGPLSEHKNNKDFHFQHVLSTVGGKLSTWRWISRAKGYMHVWKPWGQGNSFSDCSKETWSRGFSPSLSDPNMYGAWISQILKDYISVIKTDTLGFRACSSWWIREEAYPSRLDHLAHRLVQDQRVWMQHPLAILLPW